MDAEFDLPALGAALWRQKWKILGPTLIVALLAFVAVQVITPRYMSEARVIVEGRDNIYLRPDADKDTGDRAVDEQAVVSQAQLILSRDLASEVITKLKLGERPEFDSALAGVSSLKAILGALGFSRSPLNMTPEERVLEAYYDRLTVMPVEKSRVITIDFLSSDPELAARVANAIAEAYLLRQREAKQEQAASAGQWLSGQIDTMRKKVAEAESKAATFRAKSNLLVGPNNTTLSSQQLGEFNAQLTAARGQKADTETRAKMIREMLQSGRPIESSDILNSELIRRLSEQRITLRAQLAEQSSTLLDGHPRIKELKAQIAEIDGQIRTEAETLARTFENDSKLASARVDSLMASFDQLKGQAATTNEQDVQLRALDLEAKSQRDLLESYLAKYREATSRDTINSAPADARVFSRATVSNVPAYPKKLPTVLIAAVTTLVLCSGLVLTKELLAGPVNYAPAYAPMPAQPASGDAVGIGPRVAALFGGKSRNEVRQNEMLRQNAAHQNIHQNAAHNVVGVPISAIADVAYSLRQSGAARRIAVLGAGQGIGTSQTAIKLARALAEDSRVVLVGLFASDMAIRKISNEPTASGLAELANGTAGFSDIITKDRLSPLHLISSGRTPTDRIDILSAPGMATSFEALARSYDHVVFDAGGIVGPEIEAIGEIAPHAIVVSETLNNAATASARERLLAAGFADVTVLVGARPSFGEAAAAA